MDVSSPRAELVTSPLPNFWDESGSSFPVLAPAPGGRAPCEPSESELLKRTATEPPPTPAESGKAQARDNPCRAETCPDVVEHTASSSKAAEARSPEPAPPPEALHEDEELLTTDFVAARRRRSTAVPKFDLERLATSKLLILLSVWHSYGLWLAICIYIVLAVNLLLSWYIELYRQSSTHDEFPSGLFFSIFFRAWMLVFLAGDLARFCFLLLKDTWATDAYSSYRHALCGELYEQLEEETINLKRRSGASLIWSARMLDSRRRWIDRVVQIAIYLSLDGYPIFCGVLTGLSEGHGGNIPTEVTQCLATASCLHATLFFVAWTLTDLVLKVVSFRDLCRGGQPASREALIEADVTAEEAPPDAVVARRHTAEITDGPSTDRLIGASVRPSQVAEELNVCLPVCRCFDGFLSQLGIFNTLGYVAARILLFAIFTAVWCITLPFVLCWRHRPQCVRDCLTRNGCVRRARSPRSQQRLEALHAWGENHCSLSIDAQCEIRRTFGMVLFLQGTMFVFLKQWTIVAIFVAAFVGNSVRIHTLYFEYPWGWLFGLVEGIGAGILAIVLNRENYSLDTRLMLLTIALVALRQFGLARKNRRGNLVARLVTVLLSLCLLIVVALVIFTPGSTSADTWTAFCDPSQANCTYYNIGYKPVTSVPGSQCALRYPLGKDGSQGSLTLGDFGLMSAVAYEGGDTIDSALQHYFPGWKVTFSRLPKTTGKVDADWTTFYEFYNSQTKTTVFAIRGTSAILDVLNDVNIWAPAVFMQAFEFMGPQFSSSASEAIARMTTMVTGTGRRFVDSGLRTSKSSRPHLKYTIP
eukprot:TRINITY_DN31543_c0_g1_i2.p1 TRINITY_DN31543_c0_g1~~TRINITY_DN31543_c0_g1_i2.p1  ORF type:complete len:814 (+),score=60.06 TRINITY_DN31543_c0_g1_i2:68-2509(+)